MYIHDIKINDSAHNIGIKTPKSARDKRYTQPTDAYVMNRAVDESRGQKDKTNGKPDRIRAIQASKQIKILQNTVQWLFLWEKTTGKSIEASSRHPKD